MATNNHPNRDWRIKWDVTDNTATHKPSGRVYIWDETAKEPKVFKAETIAVKDSAKLYRQAKKLFLGLKNEVTS